MAHRTLEISQISATDLVGVNVNNFSKTGVYAVLSLSGDNQSSQRTPTDGVGGRNPRWNSTLRFSVPSEGIDPSRLALHVHLRGERVLGHCDIGEVHVPISQLLSHGAPSDRRFVFYTILSPFSREPKGVLSFYYKLGEPTASAAAAPRPSPSAAHPYPPPEEGVGGATALSSAAAPYPPPYGYGNLPLAVASAQSGYGYPPPPQQTGYGYLLPPLQYGYGYPLPPLQYGYGYPPPAAASAQGYGAPPPVAAKLQKNKNNFSLWLRCELGLSLGSTAVDYAETTTTTQKTTTTTTTTQKTTTTSTFKSSFK